MSESVLLRIAVSVAMLFSALALPAQERLRPDRPVAFVGGMLLDGYEAPPIHHAVVVIDNGRIVAVGSESDTGIPPDAVVIDTGGRTILPGLIDAHAHVDLIGHGDYVRYYEFLRGMERIDEVMPIGARQMLRAGVTSAIDLGAPFQVLGLPPGSSSRPAPAWVSARMRPVLSIFTPRPSGARCRRWSTAA